MSPFHGLFQKLWHIRTPKMAKNRPWRSKKINFRFMPLSAQILKALDERISTNYRTTHDGHIWPRCRDQIMSKSDKKSIFQKSTKNQTDIESVHMAHILKTLDEGNPTHCCRSHIGHVWSRFRDKNFSKSV